jgi:peptidoglycan/xylan/chitin deacetylase (PgdA/CDA1 family)
MYVTSATLERHMGYLREWYNVVPLDEIFTQRTPARTCAVTFDDGWADNYAWAFPVLATYGIPATIFLATNLIGTTQWPWPDRLCLHVHTLPVSDVLSVVNEAFRKIGRPPMRLGAVSTDRYAAADAMVAALKPLPPPLVDAVLAKLTGMSTGADAGLRGQRPWLTWDEVSEMSQAGIAFGSHTHNHRILTQAPVGEARREIEDSRDMLAAKIGKRVTTFCYPNGNYNSELMHLVADSGFQIAVTTERGRVDLAGSPMAVNRLMIHDDMTSTVPMFACVITRTVPFF